MNDFREYKAAFLEQNDLAHFGILGMKWGVRRYQNPDGSLTPAGKRHYYKQEVKKANKATGEQKRGEEAYRLSQTDYIKDAVNKIEVMDKNNGYFVGPSHKEVQKLAEDLISSKFLGEYISGEKELTTDALYEAMHEKYSKERKSYDEEKYRNATPEVKKLYDDGWKDGAYGDDLKKYDGVDSYSIVKDKNGSYAKTKKQYDSFKKREKEHVESIINQILKNDRWDNWTDKIEQLEKELRSARKSFEFNPDGLLYGLIGGNGIPELGYHSIEIEYDPLTKRLHQQSLAG